MRPIQRLFILYFLLPVLLLSTTGVPLYSMYCLCKGERTVSLLTPAPDACQAHQTKAPPTKACCKDKAAACHLPTEKTSGPSLSHCCTEGEAHFYKLAVQYLSVDVDLPTLTAPNPPASPALLPVGLHEMSTRSWSQLFAQYHPPPRPAGRDWLSLGQILRC